MKKRSLKIVVGMVFAIGAAVVGAVVVGVAGNRGQDDQKVENVSVKFEWDRDVSPISLKVSFAKSIDLEVTEDLTMKSIFPCALNVSDRYFKYLRLRFDGKGKGGAVPVDVVTEAVVRPSIGGGEALSLVVAEIVRVSTTLYDASGSEVKADVSAVDGAVRMILLKTRISLPSISLPYADLRVVDEQLWLNNDGLECRAFATER